MDRIVVEFKLQGLLHNPRSPLRARVPALLDLTQGRGAGRVGAGHHEAGGHHGGDDQVMAGKVETCAINKSTL